MKSNHAVTIAEIMEEVCEHKRISRVTLYHQMHLLNIKPIGARQIPQLYPADTAERILERYGFVTTSKR